MTHPARAILERLAYVIYLGLLVCSIGVTWLGGIAGFVTGDFGPMWLAVLGLTICVALHSVGHAHWHFRECEETLNRGAGSDGLLRTEIEVKRATEFATLLAQKDTATDVWTRGEVRRQLQALLDAAPDLREEFEAEIAAHSDLV